MPNKHELRVSAQYSSEGEFWKVEVLDAGGVIASAERLPNSAKAREAGEYLSFAIADDWQLLHAPSDRAIAEGIAAVKSKLETELEQDPASDGFMNPSRLLRKIFGAIRGAQVIEFHRDDADTVDAAKYVLGWQWALRMGRPTEKPKTERWRESVPPRTVIPGLKYLILALDDAKMLAERIRFPASDQPVRLNDILARIDAETGADIEEIVAQLKALDPCHACMHESMERCCVCWRANRLGRRIARLVDRANAGRGSGGDNESE